MNRVAAKKSRLKYETWIEQLRQLRRTNTKLKNLLKAMKGKEKSDALDDELPYQT